MLLKKNSNKKFILFVEFEFFQSFDKGKIKFLQVQWISAIFSHK